MGSPTKWSSRCPRGAWRSGGSGWRSTAWRLDAVETRFGNKVLPLVDPHGLKRGARGHQLDARVRAVEWRSGCRRTAGARALWRAGLGASRGGDRRVSRARTRVSAGRRRERLDALRFSDAAGVIDVRETPDQRRGRWGVGSVHHLAWRVDDETHQLAVRDEVIAVRRSSDAGHRPLLVQVGVLQGAGRGVVRAGDRRARVCGGRRSAASGRDARPAAVPRAERAKIEAVLPDLRYASASK